MPPSSLPATPTPRVAANTVPSPVAAVAALRETSILFAAALSFFLFKEALGRYRILGILVILSGVALIRIA